MLFVRMIGCLSVILILANCSNPTSSTGNTQTSTLPTIPALHTPDNGATGIDTSALLTWSPSTRAVSYRVQVSTSLSFPTNATTDISGLSDTSYTAGGLTENVIYYWRVSAANSSGSSDWTITRSFTTSWLQAPAIPALSSPSNGLTGISINPALTWSSSLRADSYRLQVSTSNSFTSTTSDQNGLTNISKSINGLSSKTIYYWRVNATNGKGSSSWSEMWSFTTGLYKSSSKYGFSICLPTEWTLESDDDDITYGTSVNTSVFLTFILLDTIGAADKQAGLVIGAYWPITKTYTQSELQNLAQAFSDGAIKLGTSLTTSQVTIDGNVGCEGSYLDNGSVTDRYNVTFIQHGKILFSLVGFTPDGNSGIGKQGLHDIIALSKFQSATVAKVLAKSLGAPIPEKENISVIDFGHLSASCSRIQGKLH